MSFNEQILSGDNEGSRVSTNGINVGEIERGASAIAGGALALYGLRRRTWGGLILTLAGTALVHRGATGHCNTYEVLGITTKRNGDKAAPVAKDIHVEKSITIGKSPEELYSFWRQFDNLPRFMKHLESVTCTDLNRSHWIAKGPAGTNVEWDAEIYNEKPNELIAWRSLPGADITNAGSVRFEAAGERGTVVKVNLNYNAPGGKVSAFLAKLFGQEPGQIIEEDLRRLKQILETGEIATIEGQPSGRDANARPLAETETIGGETTKSPKGRAASAGN